MIEKWMRADPLMSLLLNRGEGAEHSYEIVERVAVLVEAGTPELDAIESALGYIPHSERERLDQKARADV